MAASHCEQRQSLGAHASLIFSQHPAASNTPGNDNHIHEDDDDENLSVSFDSAEEFDADLSDDPSSDLTKSYNRQRQLHGDTPAGAITSPSAVAKPRSNAQRPAANTRARIDDQITELSKHAAKIRLDDVKQDQGRTKDRADRATSELVLDNQTRMILLQTVNRGFVSEIHGAISTGKEANVYGAVLHPADDGPDIQRAVKIYKTSILVFKDRERYIAGEHRFKNGAHKGNSRKMVRLWAEKEFRNLKRLHAAGIPCPEPLMLKQHVIVMSFLGDERGWAYPRLRDANIEGDDVDGLWRSLYVQLVGIMRRLYRVCSLVHADLSEYNILYNNKTLYIIDVSQSVEPDHPRSLDFLRMDIKNVGDFFRRKNVDTLPDPAVFDFITAPEGPVEEPALSQAIEHLYKTRPAVADTAEAAAKFEVDTEVFRNQYIPQTLDEVYDIEKDSVRPVGELVYKNMLAGQVGTTTGGKAARRGGRQGGRKTEGEVSKAEKRVGKTEEAGERKTEEGSSDDAGSESGASRRSSQGEKGEDESEVHAESDRDEEEEEEEGGRPFDKGRPRGKRHEDKEEKRAHKQAVKEERRRKRQEKIPKHLKQRLVSITAKRKNNK
ncbi:hypothetical protein VTK26DRAFT_6154 [Humicola hyalothermophila]